MLLSFDLNGHALVFMSRISNCVTTDPALSDEPRLGMFHSVYFGSSGARIASSVSLTRSDVVAHNMSCIYNIVSERAID